MFLTKPVAPTVSLVEQASQSADQTIKSTQKVANEALITLTDAMQDLRHKATPLMERASDSIRGMAHHSMDSVRETSHQLRVKAEHASENTVNYIKHEPVKSVLIAAATGATLMALITLVSRNRP